MNKGLGGGKERKRCFERFYIRMKCIRRSLKATRHLLRIDNRWLSSYELLRPPAHWLTIQLSRALPLLLPRTFSVSSLMLLRSINIVCSFSALTYFAIVVLCFFFPCALGCCFPAPAYSYFDLASLSWSC